MSNPFKAGVYNGNQTYHTSGSERLHQIKGFNLEQCKAGLRDEGLKKAVEKALNAKVRG
jgi:hypothetical protein